MGSKSNKPTIETIELDEFLSNLTEVELETSSKTIFSLCETARDVDFYKSERAVLDSFIEWARSESRKFKGGTANLDNGTAKEVESDQNTPIEPKKAPFAVEIIPSQEKLLELNRAVMRRGIGRGCNDLLPEEKSILNPGEWQFVCREYHEWNGDLKDFDPSHPVMFDFMVIAFLDFYFYGGN